MPEVTSPADPCPTAVRPYHRPVRLVLLAHGSPGLAGDGVPGPALYVAAVVASVLGVVALRARGAAPLGGPAVAPLSLDAAEAGPWPGDALPAPTRVAGQAVGLGALALTLAVGWLGSDLLGLNPVPLALRLVWWTVPLLALLLGDWWRVVDPHDALAGAVDRLRGRTRPGPGGVEVDREAGDWWVPALLLATFAWMATCWIEGLRPRNLALWLTLVTLVLLVGAVVGGRAWVRRCSPLAVLCGTIAAAAPVVWSGGRVALRSPLRGLAARAGGRRSLAALSVVLGATFWESVSGTQWWSDLSGGSGDQALVWSTLGLAWCTLLVAGAWVLVGRATQHVAARAGGPEPDEPLGPDMAAALGPLAAVAVVAHQLSTWLIDVQDLVVLGLDPFSQGWGLVDTSTWRADEAVLSPAVTSWVSLALVTGALGLGLVASWDRVTSRCGRAVLQAGWVLGAWTAGVGMLALWLLLGA